MISLAWFFLTIALAVHDLLWFHTDCRIFLFWFCEKCCWHFDRDYIESLDCFEEYECFNNSRSWIHDFPFICIIFNSFYQCLTVFRVSVFSSSWLDLFLGILLSAFIVKTSQNVASNFNFYLLSCGRSQELVSFLLITLCCTKEGVRQEWERISWNFLAFYVFFLLY